MWLVVSPMQTITQEVYRSQGQALPQDPWQQLQMGVHAVFGSWNSPRAIKYRCARLFARWLHPRAPRQDPASACPLPPRRNRLLSVV